MNRLRIVVEETGPDAYQVLYCGTDRAKAEAALHAPSPKDRALFVKPSVSAYNRPILAAAAPAAATVTEPKAAAEPKPVATTKKK
jgi:hypothetical protein